MKRRDLLKAGACAATVAVVPLASASATPSRETVLAQLRADYLARVRAFAELQRPRIVAALADVDPDPDSFCADIVEPLEERCAKEFCPTVDDARLTWALTPHWLDDGIEGFKDIRLGVGCLVARDVVDALAIPELAARYRVLTEACS